MKDTMFCLYTLWSGDEGQDLVEYTLLLAFIVLVSAAAFLGVGPTTSGLWSIANSRLAAANQAVNSGS